MQKNKKLIIWTIFYLLIFAFLLYSSFDYLDTDFGWHIKVGEEISREFKAPTIEKYDYPIIGRYWVDHEWLANLILFGIYKYLGFFALNIAFALLVILTLILLRFLARIGLNQTLLPGPDASLKSDLLIMFFQLWGVLASHPHLGVRIQEIALLNTVLLLIIIYKFSRQGSIKILFFLPLLFFAWANIHASFLIGLFIMLLWPLAKISERNIKKIEFFNFINYNYLQPGKNIFIFLVFAALSAAATFFTPYGFKIYSFLKDYANTFYMARIEEWLTPYTIPIQYRQLLYIGVFLVVVSLTLFFYFKQKGARVADKKQPVRLDLFWLALSIIMAVMALKSKRNFPLFFVASLPLLISLLDHLIKANPGEIFKKLLKTKVAVLYLATTVILSLAILILKTNFNNNPFTNEKYCQFYPCQAIDFIKDKPEYKNLKIFNNYGWGGFMIWVWPEKQLFIDGRLPQFKLGSSTMLEEYYEFFKENKSESKLNEYEIELVMIDKPHKFKLNWYEKHILGLSEAKMNDGKNYLREYLDQAAGWSEIYKDEICDVYAKKNKI